MTWHFSWLRAALGALACTAAVSANAAPDAVSFPARAITVLVPFPVGSGTDSSARLIAQEMSRLTGQTVVVENKPGANGFIATRQAALAPADGYTLLLTSNTHYVNRFLFKEVPYDPIGDFDTVAVFREPSPLVLMVSAQSSWRSLGDITEAARARPGALSYGSGNSSSRVGAELYKQLIGADILYVPYKGNAEALNEVAGGRVDMIFSDVGALRPLYEAGKLRPIVVTGESTLPFLKGVPTSKDAGMADLQIGSWGVFLAPKGTPGPILDKLNALIHEATETPAVQQYIATTDGVPSSLPRAEIDRFVKSEMEKWGSIIDKAGIQPQ